MEKTKTYHSPKNRFMGTLYFSKALGSIGSQTSVGGSDDIEEVKRFAADEVRRFSLSPRVKNHRNNEVRIIIRENKSTYPTFDWQDVRVYVVNMCDQKQVNNLAKIMDETDNNSNKSVCQITEKVAEATETLHNIEKKLQAINATTHPQHNLKNISNENLSKWQN